MAASLPNWIRIVLLALSLLSFLPQLHKLWLRRNASGISPFYVLFHLISATELFALAFFYVVNTTIEDPSDVFVHYPPQPGDYINLAQLALVWVLWLIVFAAVLLLPSENGGHHNGSRYGTNDYHGEGNNINSGVSVRNPTTPIVLSIFIAFLFVSLIPVVIDAIWSSHDVTYHKWGLALFHGIHVYLINPIVTILVFVSFFPQRNQIQQYPPGTASSSLSLIGLVVQAVVFVLLALSWIWRLVFSMDGPDDEHQIPNLVWTWYYLVGFVPVDHAMFALVQAALLAISGPRLGQWFTGSESEPLLTNQN